MTAKPINCIRREEKTLVRPLLREERRREGQAEDADATGQECGRNLGPKDRIADGNLKPAPTLAPARSHARSAFVPLMMRHARGEAASLSLEADV